MLQWRYVFEQLNTNVGLEVDNINKAPCFLLSVQHMIFEKYESKSSSTE